MCWPCSCSMVVADQKIMSHQEEVDLPDHRVLQMVLALVILKFNVQAVLNPNLHLKLPHTLDEIKSLRLIAHDILQLLHGAPTLLCPDMQPSSTFSVSPIMPSAASHEHVCSVTHPAASTFMGGRLLGGGGGE